MLAVCLWVWLRTFSKTYCALDYALDNDLDNAPDNDPENDLDSDLNGVLDSVLVHDLDHDLIQVTSPNRGRLLLHLLLRIWKGDILHFYTREGGLEVLSIQTPCLTTKTNCKFCLACFSKSKMSTKFK